MQHYISITPYDPWDRHPAGSTGNAALEQTIVGVCVAAPISTFGAHKPQNNIAIAVTKRQS